MYYRRFDSILKGTTALYCASLLLQVQTLTMLTAFLPLWLVFLIPWAGSLIMQGLSFVISGTMTVKLAADLEQTALFLWNSATQPSTFALLVTWLQKSRTPCVSVIPCTRGWRSKRSKSDIKLHLLCSVLQSVGYPWLLLWRKWWPESGNGENLKCAWHASIVLAGSKISNRFQFTEFQVITNTIDFKWTTQVV